MSDVLYWYLTSGLMKSTKSVIVVVSSFSLFPLISLDAFGSILTSNVPLNSL